jgi:predicted transcriptional regulator
MNINKFVQQFNLGVAAGKNGLDRQIQSGYSGDLLSDVMANAPIGCIWLTVQVHQNIVKVAVLRDMAAIVLTGGQTPDKETVERANQEGVPILLWSDSAFDLAGKLYSAGITKSPD